MSYKITNLYSMKRLLYTYLSVFVFGLSNAQTYTESQIGFSVTAQLGTQNNLINLAITGAGLVQADKYVNEIGAGLGFDVAFTRHGIFTSHLNFKLESYYIAGIKESPSGIFYSGELNAIPVDNLIERLNTFNGLGIGFKRSYTTGRLAPFNNKNWVLLLRNRYVEDVSILRYTNNLSKKDSQGEIATLGFNLYTQNPTSLELHQFGVNLELFTPEPDYDTSEKEFATVVHQGNSPFSNLFHSNLYLTYGYTQDNFIQRVKLGVDHKQLGGKLHKKLHEPLKLNPLFTWPDVPYELYLQLESSYNDVY